MQGRKGGLPFIGYNYSSWSSSYPASVPGSDPSGIYNDPAQYADSYGYANCGYPYIDPTVPAATVRREPDAPWINLLAGFFTQSGSSGSYNYAFFGCRGSSGVYNDSNNYADNYSYKNRSNAILSHNTRTLGWIPGTAGSGAVIDDRNGQAPISGNVDFTGGSGAVVLCPASMTSGTVQSGNGGKSFVTIEM